MVAGASAAPLPGDDEVDAAIRSRIASGERPKEIAAILAGPTGRSKRDLYARALALLSETS